MKQHERELIAQAFREAKPRFARTRRGWTVGNKEEFICHSLQSYCDADGGMKARKVVTQRLGRCTTVDAWLRQNVPEADLLALKDYKKFEEEVQKYRHRWLDSLIAEFNQEE